MLPAGPTRGPRARPQAPPRRREQRDASQSLSSYAYWKQGGGASLARHLIAHPALEGGDQRLGAEEQPSLGQGPRRHAAVDGLDQRGVLASDLVVEGEEVDQ